MEQAITELINTVGFPTAMCVAFGYYITKRDNQRAETEKEARAQTIEERQKLIQTIENNRKVNEELLQTNRELSETNRQLVYEISGKVNNIENTLVEINQKM